MKRLALALILCAGFLAPAVAQNGGQGLGSVVTQQALQNLTAPLPGDLIMLFRGQNGQAVFGQYDSGYVMQAPQGTSIPGVVVLCYTGLTTVAGTPVATPCPDTVIHDVAGQPVGSNIASTYSPPLVTAAAPRLACGPPVLSKWNPLTGCFNP